MVAVSRWYFDHTSAEIERRGSLFVIRDAIFVVRCSSLASRVTNYELLFPFPSKPYKQKLLITNFYFFPLMVKVTKKIKPESFRLENYLEKRSAMRVARHASSSMSIAPVLFFVVLLRRSDQGEVQSSLFVVRNLFN